MARPPYKAAPEIFNEAVNAIIEAELLVASGRADACCVFLDRKSGRIKMDRILFEPRANYGDVVLLWAVTCARPINDIKALMFKSKGEPFCGDSLVEWYLKHCFGGVLNWNFGGDLIYRVCNEDPLQVLREEGLFD